MKLQGRLHKLVRYLNINRNNEPINSAKLAEKFDISERTLRSDVKAINQLIFKHGAEIKHLRLKGYILVLNDESKFESYVLKSDYKNNCYPELETVDKRIEHLIIKLLYENKYVSLDNLSESVYVSNSTLLNYLSTIKDLFSEYDLTLFNKSNIGYIVKGEEDQKRMCLYSVLSNDNIYTPYLWSDTQKRIFEGINLNKISKIILDNLGKELSLTDFNLKNLTLHIALMISRVNNGYEIQGFQIPKFKNKLKKPIDNLFVNIENEFKIEIDDGEKNYIYKHLFSNLDTVISEVSNNTVKNITNLILKNLFVRYGYDLSSDIVFVQDLNLHMKSILSIKPFNLQRKNPLLYMIKSNYPFEYEMALIALEESLPNGLVGFSEDEVAYVALHIGAALERLNYAAKTKKKIAIVCGSGYATIQMIEAQLISYFNHSINIIHKLSYNEFINFDVADTDIIVTTMPILKEINIPVIQIDLPISKNSIKKLKSIINKDKKTNDIDVYFDEDLFIYESKKIEKNVVIRNQVNKLADLGLVDDFFFEDVMRREALASTLMSDMVAIPHPLNATSKETKIVVTILKHPVEWYGVNTASIVLLLAIAEKDKDQLQHLYDAFVSIMTSIEVQKNIMKSKSTNSFLKIVHEALALERGE